MIFEEKTKNKFKKEEICGSMIYFLIKNNDVVYVGQSKVGLARIYAHKYPDKDYDSLYFIKCKEEELNSLENYYIMKYKPKYNKTLNKEINLISYSNFYYFEYHTKKVPRLSFKEAKKEIIKNNLYQTIYKRTLFLNKDRLNEINSFLADISLKIYKKGEKYEKENKRR